jgi:hypothetical protein
VVQPLACPCPNRWKLLAISAVPGPRLIPPRRTGAAGPSSSASSRNTWPAWCRELAVMTERLRRGDGSASTGGGAVGRAADAADDRPLPEDVGDGNFMHWEVGGNPHGKPAVVLRGGPVSGCSPSAHAMPGRVLALLLA